MTEDKAIIQLVDLLAIDCHFISFVSIELINQCMYTDLIQFFAVDVQCYDGIVFDCVTLFAV